MSGGVLARRYARRLTTLPETARRLVGEAVVEMRRAGMSYREITKALRGTENRWSRVARRELERRELADLGFDSNKIEQWQRPRPPRVEIAHLQRGGGPDSARKRTRKKGI